MLVICVRGDPCLRVLSAKKSSCLNVGSLWWWNPWLNVLSTKIVIMPES